MIPYTLIISKELVIADINSYFVGRPITVVITEIWQ